MPKSIPIDPIEVRRQSKLASAVILLNAYQTDPAAETVKYGSEALVRMYRDIVVIREFETMQDRVKKDGKYQGIAYAHLGPAHLSIGQEAAVAGQSFHLTPDDFILGSHRSHGEIPAKSFSAIAQPHKADLLRIM